jgi:hypothetical protein
MPKRVFKSQLHPQTEYTDQQNKDGRAFLKIRKGKAKMPAASARLHYLFPINCPPKYN